MQHLLDTSKETAHHATATLKEKTEEIVFFHEAIQSWKSPATPVNYEMAYVEEMPETYKAAVFQPPRFKA